MMGTLVLQMTAFLRLKVSDRQAQRIPRTCLPELPDVNFDALPPRPREAVREGKRVDVISYVGQERSVPEMPGDPSSSPAQAMRRSGDRP